MAELIPERRTDKNGITSTKWVKPAEKTAVRNWAPPPSLGDIVKRKEMVTALANEIHDTIYGAEGFEYETIRELEESLNRYTNDVLQRIKDLFDDYSTGFRYHGGAHHFLAEKVESGANSETVSDLVKYLTDGIPHDSIVAYSYYRQRGWIDWDISNDDDPRLFALMNTAESIERVTRPQRPTARKAGGPEELWDIPVIKDERLFNLVLERIEDNDRIIDIIEDGKVDCDLIVAALEEPAQALSKGVL